MADRQSPFSRPSPRTPTAGSPASSNFLQRIHQNAPGSFQLFGLLTLIVTGGILVLFTGLTITVSVLGLIFFSPLIILTSPIWIPVGAVTVFVVGCFLCFCGAAVATVASFSWLYKYLRGQHPIGAERVDYARSQIANTASHVKDYAWEYGGYLQSKVKDAAPGA